MDEGLPRECTSIGWRPPTWVHTQECTSANDPDMREFPAKFGPLWLTKYWWKPLDLTRAHNIFLKRYFHLEHQHSILYIIHYGYSFALSCQHNILHWYLRQNPKWCQVICKSPGMDTDSMSSSISYQVSYISLNTIEYPPYTDLTFPCCSFKSRFVFKHELLDLELGMILQII